MYSKSLNTTITTISEAETIKIIPITVSAFSLKPSSLIIFLKGAGKNSNRKKTSLSCEQKSLFCVQLNTQPK